MLKDQDRIFKNIYCQDDWRLAGARRRGIWDNTKTLLEVGPRQDRRRNQGVGTARPRWSNT